MVERTSDTKEIGNLFRKMMKSIEDNSPTDKKFEQDMQDFALKIQWDICGIKGYQIFNNGDYSWGFEEKLDDPEIILEITEIEVALKFLRGEIDNFTFYYYKDKFVLNYVERWKSVKVDNKMLREREQKLLLSCYYVKGYNKKYHPFILTKIPIFRDIAEKWYDPETADAYYLPINESLGKFEDQILPVKVLEHFINKSAHYLLFDCGCRKAHKCQDHDVSIGCMYLGADVVNWQDVYPKDNNGHFGTREEALERVQLAYENGLVAVLGRLKLESESMGIPDRGQFMVVCFCCPCCCINTKFKLGTYEMGQFIKRIDGISVEVDRELCTGCEQCMEVCSFDGMEIIDVKARVNQEKCLGCGRCERVCPSEAISITLEDPKQISDLFRKIEANVDVS